MRMESDLNMDVIPEFLLRARDAVAAGRIEEAASLINDSAVEVVRYMVDEDPSRMDMAFILAAVLWKIGQEKKAEQWYKIILQAGPNAAAYNKLGCLYQIHGAYFPGR